MALQVASWQVGSTLGLRAAGGRPPLQPATTTHISRSGAISPFCNNHADRCLFGCQGGFGARVAVSAVTKVMLMGVGWRVARGGYVEEPAIQDATPATHATETFLGAPRALTRLLVGS
jgi:hypothetical protein